MVNLNALGPSKELDMSTRASLPHAGWLSSTPLHPVQLPGFARMCQDFWDLPGFAPQFSPKNFAACYVCAKKSRWCVGWLPWGGAPFGFVAKIAKIH